MSSMSRVCASSTSCAKSWPPWESFALRRPRKAPSLALFQRNFAKKRRKKGKKYRFQTIKPAIRAYLKHRKVKGLTSGETDVANPEALDREWREPVLPPCPGHRHSALSNALLSAARRPPGGNVACRSRPA
jgi:hypothetical protein